jgi:predicted DNA-binding protein with PD1-like motif
LLEITSLQGNLAWKNDEPIWHIHGTFGDEHYNAIAGHIKELIVGGTCELHLHAIFGDQPLARSHNNKIGLELLDL